MLQHGANTYEMSATSTYEGSLSIEGIPTPLAHPHAHTVQFYGEDGALLHELTKYIGSALATGSSAIVIATQGHLDGLSKTLDGQGINVGTAIAENRYIALDAADVLSQFMGGDSPDEIRFTETIGSVIARASSASRHESKRVVAFGEMVALLWAEGQHEAALKLEKLWNDLAKTYSFALHCAYPMQGFSRQDLSESIFNICAEHTAMISDGSYIGFESDDMNVQSRSSASTGIGPEVQRQLKQEAFPLFIDRIEDYAVFMLDPGGRIATWNAGAERVKGYKENEILGRHFSVFYPDEDVRQGKPQQLLDTALKNGRVHDDGWRVRKDGSRFWASVSITPVKDTSGKLIGFGKVTQDRTEQMRGELALRRSEERARLFIEAVQDYAIFMLDPDGNVSTWNTGAERIKGYKASEIVGQHFSVFYPEADLRLDKPNWELEIAKAKGRCEDDGWRIRKDGSRFWAHVVITAIKDHSGELLGFCKVTQDATERMQAQQRIEESEKSLRQLSLHLLRTQDEERRRIGREIHDSLGQYLSALKIKIDSLSAVPDADEEIAQCGKLLEECIREVRTISYLMYPPMLEEMELKSAIPWYLEGFSKRSGIKTTLHIPDDFQRLSRDAELVLFRVLQETLTNVQRHSGSATAEIVIFDTSESFTLQITDCGKGVPSAILEQANEDWMGSLGVGLRGMSERLRQLGGTLQVTSSESGTVVRAVVPLKELRSADPISA